MLDLMRPLPQPPLDARLLSKALGEGRVRGIAAELDAAARVDLRRAGGVLRRGLRDARALHSRERRLVSDALYDGFRWGPVLEVATGLNGFDGRWLGWLALHGLDPAELPDPARWQRFVAGDLPLDAGVLAGGQAVWEVLSAALGDRAAAFVATSNARAPVQIRAQGLTRDALARELADAGITTEPCTHAPLGLTVIGSANLRGHKAFTQGRFEVQDEGSQLLAGLVPTDADVLDLCAGAGGKSLALAAAGAHVTALDVRPSPLDELSKRARRARLTVHTRRLGPRGEVPEDVKPAAAVLVDAPCTGSGTWRRHPDLRWRLDELDATVALQAQILDRAADLVKPGGVLVYGTCSVLPAEDEAQVEAFLARHPDFALDPLGQPELGGEVLRVAPDTHGTDGFFGARLRRRH
ncbi:MAG: RsmB/NOP family class I SAM-dependent RNA methyltransferase [Deltaproteobacteria bacterium]|nr:MAG: RsmB/NOP family class I SAM-dependent RNA methyltransferase [Deltaproteobacteria bacterium]